MYIKIFRTIVHMRLSSPSVTYPFAARMNFHYKHSAYILFSSIALRNFFTNPPKKQHGCALKILLYPHLCMPPVKPNAFCQ